MISIAIVEDNKDFRNILADYLQSQPDFRVIGLYPDAAQALTGLVANAPDIAIIDIQMPGMGGIELISAIKAMLPSTQYLVCTSHHDNETVFNALKSGASGYILKDEASNGIKNAIIELHNGGSPMSPYIARKVISSLQQSSKPNDEFDLTSREHEVLQHLSKGFLYKEIADKMLISPLTVKNHLKNIYRKLHVQNKVEAINKYKKT